MDQPMDHQQEIFRLETSLQEPEARVMAGLVAQGETTYIVVSYIVAQEMADQGVHLARMVQMARLLQLELLPRFLNPSFV